MRVISGSARGCQLIAPAGDETRPTTDRIKETLFNILFTKVYESRVLDLYSGSGALGIEALSRGSKNCVFVECSLKALAALEKNLTKTRLQDRGKILKMRVAQALPLLKEPFDIILMDPPYELGEEEKVIRYILQNNLLAKDGIIVVEAKASRIFDYVHSLSLEIYKEKNYGITKHIFLRQIEKPGDF